MQKFELYRFLKSSNLPLYKRLAKKYAKGKGLLSAFHVYRLAHGRKARSSEDVIILGALRTSGIIARVA